MVLLVVVTRQEAGPLVSRSCTLVAAIKPLILSDVRQLTSLTLLWASKRLVVHLLTSNGLLVLGSSRRWRDQQRRNTADRAVRAVALLQVIGW